MAAVTSCLVSRMISMPSVYVISCRRAIPRYSSLQQKDDRLFWVLVLYQKAAVTSCLLHPIMSMSPKYAISWTAILNSVTFPTTPVFRRTLCRISPCLKSRTVSNHLEKSFPTLTKLLVLLNAILHSFISWQENWTLTLRHMHDSL